MSETTEIETITVATLPPLREALAGGKFAGVITLEDGTHHAVVLLDARPEKGMPWQKAMDWAKSVGGRLPSRAIGMLLYVTCHELVGSAWIWTDEPDGASGAWYCTFDNGYVDLYNRSAEGAGVAVRLIPLNA